MLAALCAAALLLAPSALATPIPAAPGSRPVFHQHIRPQDAPPEHAYAGDAPYSAAAGKLAAVLSCPNGRPAAGSKAVLLVHGTGSTGNETWGSGYVPALTSAGFEPCYLTLPNRALSDLQSLSSYVAYNIHDLASFTSAPVSVISHSTAGPLVQWALQFYPSTRARVSSFTALAPTFSGLSLASNPLLTSLCGRDPVSAHKTCQPALWQLTRGSEFLASLDFASSAAAPDHHSGAVALVPTTLVYSDTDELAGPSPRRNARLPGAVAVSIGDVCPGRTADHFEMATDAAGFAVAFDALTNGRVEIGRVARRSERICENYSVAQDMDEHVADRSRTIFDRLRGGFILGAPKIDEETPILPYARIWNQQARLSSP